MPARKPVRRETVRAAVPKAGRPPRSTSGGDSLTAYIREISRFHPLSGDEEKALGRRIREGDQEAVQRLVEANLRFVVSYCKRYRGLGLAYLDLIHEGTLGLIEAAKRFDPERNVKFISYAVWWVRQSIFQALSEQHRAFRVPQKLSGQIAKVSQVRERLSAELERPPSTAELARATHLPESEVEEILRVAGDDLSLSTAIGEDGGLELGDTLEQHTIPSVESQLIQSSFEGWIRTLLSRLDQKEQQVIGLRFGLDGEEDRTLQEIGDQLRLSRERVRQIESKAKEKLRRLIGDELARRRAPTAARGVSP